MASIEYVVNAIDDASTTFMRIAKSADALNEDLDRLSKQVARPEVDLNDADYNLKIAQAAQKIDKLKEKVADPQIDLKGMQTAQLQIARLEVSLDRLNNRRVTATVDVNTRGGLLSRVRGLFGGGGGDGGAGSSALGAGGSAASSGGLLGVLGAAGLGPWGWGALGVGGALITPALLPTLLGGGIGGAGALGGIMLGKAAEKQLQALGKQLGSAKGSAAVGIKQQMAQIQKQNAGPLAIFGAAQDLGAVLKQTFSDAVTSRGAGGTSFLSGMTGILKQLAGFVKTIGPELGQMFRASLPFVSMFVKFMEQLAKTLLPVFTQMLKQMTPFLPLISQGLKQIVTGLAGMLEAMGPRGMRDSAKIFVDLCKLMGWALAGLGKAINFIAVTVQYTAHAIHQQWDLLRHQTADAFDQIRHDIAHYWDVIYNNTIGAVIHIVRDIENWVHRLPPDIRGILSGLGHMLEGIATGSLNDFLKGLKSVAGSVFSWVGNFVSTIWKKVKGFFGINSPSSKFYDIGKNLMLGLFHGIKDHAHLAQTAFGGALNVGGLTGPLSGNAAAAESFAASILPRGWSFPALQALWTRESGWNSYAVNPSSGAYGIPQALPAAWGHPYALGDYKAQIVWGLNYIAQRYGNSQAAWGHEMAFGWYDRGGWLQPGWTMALNTTGKPERVGGSGGDVINISVHVPPTVNPAHAGQQIAQILLEHTKRGGRLYPQGVTPR